MYKNNNNVSVEFAALAFLIASSTLLSKRTFSGLPDHLQYFVVVECLQQPT